MTGKTRTILEIALAAVAVGAVGFAAITSAAAAPSAPTVKFTVGGNTSAAANSENAPWGAPLNISMGSMYVVAAADEEVMCRITVDGKAVSESYASGRGNRAVCAFG